MKADNRWREKLVEDVRRVGEQFGGLGRLSEAIRVRNQLDEIAGPLANVTGLWDRLASFAPVAHQLETQLGQSLETLRRLQEQARALELVQLVASAREETRPAEIAFAGYIRRHVACWMATALREGDRDRVDALLEEFLVDYDFLHDLIGFSTLTEQQAAQQLSEENDKLQQLFKQTDEKLERSTVGTTNRADAEAKARFKHTFLELEGAFKNIPELRRHPEMAWLPKDKYNDETLRQWAKEAIPGFKFSGGRERKQK